MKDLLELKAELKARKEKFNQHRVANISENIISESTQVLASVSIKSKLKELIKEKIQEKLQEKIEEKVVKIKTFNRTMKQGYFSRQRGRTTYKAMI